MRRGLLRSRSLLHRRRLLPDDPERRKRYDDTELILAEILEKQTRTFFKGISDVVKERTRLQDRIINVLQLYGTETSLKALRAARDHAEKKTQGQAATAIREICREDGDG